VIDGLAIGPELMYSRISQDDVDVASFSLGVHLSYFLNRVEAAEAVKGKTYKYIGAAAFFTKSTGYEPGSILKIYAGTCEMLTTTVGFFGEAALELYYLEPKGGDSQNGNQFVLIGGLKVFLY
jgi:hypothetical protein